MEVISLSDITLSDRWHFGHICSWFLQTLIPNVLSDTINHDVIKGTYMYPLVLSSRLTCLFFYFPEKRSLVLPKPNLLCRRYIFTANGVVCSNTLGEDTALTRKYLLGMLIDYPATNRYDKSSVVRPKDWPIECQWSNQRHVIDIISKVTHDINTMHWFLLVTCIQSCIYYKVQYLYMYFIAYFM